MELKYEFENNNELSGAEEMQTVIENEKVIV